MKRFVSRTLLETLLILVAGLVVALVVNALRNQGLPLATAYQPQPEVEQAVLRDISRIDLDTLKALMEADMVLLVDAREESAYRIGHIPGARNLPLSRKESAYDEFQDELNAGLTVVTYCIDPECLDSAFLASWLQDRGIHDVMVYDGGIEGWRAAGNRIELPGGMK
ncbi:MAG TPA: rhodanese-like domain-containing protein [Candidatus Aminicenantes bacterium]|nr:rhodanese-like domain-containing protein [Candidatus Aminicenantes bacterium]